MSLVIYRVYYVLGRFHQHTLDTRAHVSDVAACSASDAVAIVAETIFKKARGFGYDRNRIDRIVPVVESRPCGACKEGRLLVRHALGDSVSVLECHACFWSTTERYVPPYPGTR